MKKPELFKGPRSSFIKTLNNDGTIERVMVSQDLVEKWDDINEITVGRANYTQRSANEADVEAGTAQQVGDLIAENWSRLEIVDYTSYTGLLKNAEFKAKLHQIEHQFDLKATANLEQTV